MNSRNAIQQELQDLRSSLPTTNTKQPVFTVPEGYFENFAASVLAKVKSPLPVPAAAELAGLSPVLAAVSRRTPYQVPENYFTHLATDLPALVNDEALPPFLQTHTKQMPYTVPDGYFDGLAAQVAAKATRPSVKLVSLPARFARYAVAAVLASVIAVSAFFYVSGNRSPLDPARQPQAWLAQKLKTIPAQDREAFLKTADASFGRTDVAHGNGEARRLLRDVSTTDLDAFLKEVPTDLELSNIN